MKKGGAERRCVEEDRGAVEREKRGGKEREVQRV